MAQGRRTQPLPPDWQRTRRRILREHRAICYLCGKPGADQVDHVVPVSRGGTDEDANLRPVHRRCHERKTGREARAAQPNRRRAPEPHPGMNAA